MWSSLAQADVARFAFTPSQGAGTRARQGSWHVQSPLLSATTPAVLLQSFLNMCQAPPSGSQFTHTMRGRIQMRTHKQLKTRNMHKPSGPRTAQHLPGRPAARGGRPARGTSSRWSPGRGGLPVPRGAKAAGPSPGGKLVGGTVQESRRTCGQKGAASFRICG